MIGAAGDRATGAPMVVITGATGFIGRYACEAFRRRGWRVRGVVRSSDRAADLPTDVQYQPWDLEREQPSPAIVQGAQVVVHLAGRAHRMVADAGDAEAYHRVNVAATAALLACARDHGVHRFIYVSSVKVLGEGERSPYGSSAALDPQDDYARSKAAAELLVRQAAAPMEWAIVRPAFVYGASGKGNFPRLVRLAATASRVPLPLAGIRNRRSMIYVENLADLLAFCAEDAQAAGRVVPAVDIQSVSTPELVRALADAMGRSARLFALPSTLVAAGARAVGRGAEWHRLSETFEVDATVLRELGWQPPVSFRDALRRSVGSVA